jgi:DNA-binding NarL/FixJ family response regulator
MLGDSMIEVIRGWRRAGGPLPWEVAQRLTNRMLLPTLTAREIEVLLPVPRGLRNKEIAADLQFSEETAQGHVKSILSKLPVHDRTEAVRVGILRGFVHIE